VTTSDTRIADKRRTFRKLHESGCFVIPNPWDIGSTRYLQGLGFKALATTSSGFAWSQGYADNAISRDMALAHLHEIVAATDLPVNADFESGFAPDAAGVGESVRLALETGIAGLSIEDSTGDTAKPLFEISEAVARIRAARSAIDKEGGDVLLVGRAECFFVGRPDLEETVARLKAYAQAGADCLYAPGIRTREQSKQSSQPWHRSRSTCWWVRRVSGRWRGLPRWVCVASASAVGWRVLHGAGSGVLPNCLRRKARLMVSPMRRRATS